MAAFATMTPFKFYARPHLWYSRAVFLSYSATRFCTVNKYHLDIFTIVCSKYHTVAFNSAQHCRLKICNNDNTLSDKLAF